MIHTPAMGIKVWNLTTDPYDSSQLAGNWQKVDEHNHALGKGVQIPTAGIVDGAVTSSKLASDLSLPPHHITHEPGGSDMYDMTKAHIADVFSNRPIADSSLDGLRFFATDKKIEWQSIGGSWQIINVLAPEVNALPSSPIDSQECIYLADTTNGVKWHLKYRSASGSSMKWECIGGQPLAANVAAFEGEGATTAYVDLNTVGPSLTAPLLGDYDVTVRCMMEGGGGAAGAGIGYMSFAVGATAASDVDATSLGFLQNTVMDTTTEATVRKTAIPANSAIVAKYRRSNTGMSVVKSNRWLFIRPVRVG